MFGSRKAASNASICSPAPNAAAFRLSRASPVIRDSSVIPLTVDTARSRFTRIPDQHWPKRRPESARPGRALRNEGWRRTFGGGKEARANVAAVLRGSR